jgi:ketosteroid isomerase-like protein
MKNRPLSLVRFAVVPAALLCVGRVFADVAADVRDTVDDFYARVAASDSTVLTQYIPEGGFTEFNAESSQLKTLDRALFAGAFAGKVQIDYHVEQPRVRVIGDAAIVTGYRVGSIAFPDGRHTEGRDCLTMLWSKQTAGWMLKHVHLSSCP